MSGNPHKIAEVQRILGPVGVEIVPVSRKIEELQTEDVERLVRDKLIKAFQAIGHPLFYRAYWPVPERPKWAASRSDPNFLGPAGSRSIRRPRCGAWGFSSLGENGAGLL